MCYDVRECYYYVICMWRRLWNIHVPTSEDMKTMNHRAARREARHVTGTPGVRRKAEKVGGVLDAHSI